MSAGAASLIGLVNPVVGTLLGIAFAHEVFGPIQALGMILVLGGVLLGQRRSTPRVVVPQEPAVVGETEKIAA
jgi:probable blue pigment (indigoidine) exporter